jgi:hypothetical protein
LTNKAVKYIVVTISAAAILAAAAFVGSGYLISRRADRKAADLHAAVHAMSMQDLAAAIARCDAPSAPETPRGGAGRRDGAYCEDVARELDDRPLEIVKVTPSGAAPSARQPD